MRDGHPMDTLINNNPIITFNKKGLDIHMRMLITKNYDIDQVNTEFLNENDFR